MTNHFLQVLVRCPKCDGQGITPTPIRRLTTTWDECPHCNGFGCKKRKPFKGIWTLSGVQTIILEGVPAQKIAAELQNYAQWLTQQKSQVIPLDAYCCETCHGAGAVRDAVLSRQHVKACRTCRSHGYTRHTRFHRITRNPKVVWVLPADGQPALPYWQWLETKENYQPILT